jgi:hypothetical protein
MNLTFQQLSSFDNGSGNIALPNVLSIRSEEPPKHNSTPKLIQKKRAPSPTANDRHDSKHVKLHHGENQQQQKDNQQQPEESVDREHTTARSNGGDIDMKNSYEIIAENRFEKPVNQCTDPALNSKADALCKKVLDVSAGVKTFALESTRELKEWKSDLREHQANIMYDLIEVIETHEPAMVFKLQQMKIEYLDKKV